MMIEIIKFALTLFLTTPISKELFLVESITSPQQVLFLNSESILFVQEEKVLKYDVDEKVFKKVRERKPNEFIGLDGNGNILSCEFEHFIIESEDEFSTLFKIKDSNGSILKELNFFETIRPIYMNEKKIIAITAVDFLEQHYYRISIESGKKKEIFVPRKQRFQPKISKNIQIKKIYDYKKRIYVIEDLFGNVYIYRTLDAINIIKPIFIKIFNPVPRRNPTNDAKPDFRLSLKFFLANRYSKATAPRNTPISIPRIFAIENPTIQPITPPNAP